MSVAWACALPCHTRFVGEGAPAMLFDLDGTLVDSVYQHVLAWHEVLGRAGMELSVWKIHRRIGMSGGLFVNALLRETGLRLSAEDARRLRSQHADAFVRRMGDVRPLPGARDLLGRLTQLKVPWAIATSGSPATAGPAIAMLGVDPPAVITREDVARAKADPDRGQLRGLADRRLGRGQPLLPGLWADAAALWFARRSLRPGANHAGRARRHSSGRPAFRSVAQFDVAARGAVHHRRHRLRRLSHHFGLPR